MEQYIMNLDGEIYDEYITRIQNLSRVFEDYVYTEKHHIRPRCLGGKNCKDNLIQLLPQEHFIAHKLLTLQYPNHKKLAQAFSMMAFVSSGNQLRYECTPEEYALAKERASFAKLGVSLSNEHKQHISDSEKGHKPYFTRSHTEEEKIKISQSITNYNLYKKDYKQVSDHHKGSKMMTNGIEQHWIYESEIQTKLDEGWWFGSCKKRKKKQSKQKL